MTPVQDGLWIWMWELGAEDVGGLWWVGTGSTTPRQLLRLGPCPTVAQMQGGWSLQSSHLLAQVLPDTRQLRTLLTDMWTRAAVCAPEWTMEHEPFIPDCASDDLRDRPRMFYRIRLSAAALHGDEIWAPHGDSQIIVIHRGRSLEEVELIENNILDGRRVVRFFSTPFGLIAIGEGSVGIVQTEGRSPSPRPRTRPSALSTP